MNPYNIRVYLSRLKSYSDWVYPQCKRKNASKLVYRKYVNNFDLKLNCEPNIVGGWLQVYISFRIGASKSNVAFVTVASSSYISSPSAIVALNERKVKCALKYETK